MNFVDKYIPKNTKDIVGQENSVYNLVKNVESFKKGKAILLHGPFGSGKTSSVYAIANELDMEVFEVNASDYRNKDQIESVVGSATKQRSLFSFDRGKIILIDDIDGMSGRKDRGGMTALVKLVTESSFPIVMTVSNPFDSKFSALRKKSIMVQFNALDHKDISERLKFICDSENIKYDESVLDDLAMRSGGDLRAAITDLQLLSSDGELKNLDLISERDRTENIIQALLKVFKTKDAEIASSAFYDCDEDVDKQMLWMEENLPKEYEGEDLAKALDCVSKADVYLGRIRRWQYWRFLVYANNMLSSGVAMAKKEKYKKFVQYKPSSRILKLWIYKNKYLKRKGICEKIAHRCHTSSKRVLQDVFPHVIKMINNGNTALIEDFDLSEEEVVWIKKQN